MCKDVDVKTKYDHQLIVQLKSGVSTLEIITGSCQDISDTKYTKHQSCSLGH